MISNGKISHKKPWLPLPVSFVGVGSNLNPEYSFVKNCGVLCVTPPTVYISLNKSHPLNDLIFKKNAFSMNTPSMSFFRKFFPELKDEEGRLVDTEMIDTFACESLDAPLIRQCPINLVCRVVDTFAVHQMNVFVARVEKTLVSAKYLIEGSRNPHMNRVNPVIWTPGNGYWEIGRVIADAFSIGHSYGKGLPGVLKHLLKMSGKGSILKTHSTYHFIKNNISRAVNLEKTEIPPRALIYPLPVTLLGANVDNKPNYCVVANCGIISHDPPVIYASSVRSHHTNKGIKQNDTFSLNIPTVSLVRKMDYCGVVSGNKVNKSKVFKTFYGKDGTAPMVESCPVNIACRVIKVHLVKHMEMFMGEVLETLITDKCFSQGDPDTKKINPIIYALNRRYWSVGFATAQ